MKKDFRVAIPEVLFLKFRSWRKDENDIATAVPTHLDASSEPP
jgi:hypothetical protein